MAKTPWLNFCRQDYARDERINLSKREEEEKRIEQDRTKPAHNNTTQPPPPTRTDNGTDRDVWFETIDDITPLFTGFGARLYDKRKGRTDTPLENEHTKAFLDDLDKVLGSQLQNRVLERDTRNVGEFDKDPNKKMQALSQEKDWVLVQTDKTQEWIAVHLENYFDWMETHITKFCKEILHDRLTNTFNEANLLLNKFKNLIDDGEFTFIENWLATRRVPTPMLLVKDHKDKGDDGNYATRLLVPATNFTQCFAKMSLLAIQGIFRANRIKAMKQRIVQASNMKISLERLNLKADGCTITTLAIIHMYLSIKHKLSRKAIKKTSARTASTKMKR